MNFAVRRKRGDVPGAPGVNQPDRAERGVAPFNCAVSEAKRHSSGVRALARGGVAPYFSPICEIFLSYPHIRLTTTTSYTSILLISRE